MATEENSEHWSHLRETVLMINVAVARIEHAMNDGNESFTSLSQSFVGIANAAENISNKIAQSNSGSNNSEINDSCADISTRVDDSIVAFQFYDRLSQRMTMVSKTLNSLTDVLNDTTKIDTQDEWLKLQKTIRSKYTLDADQEMFDAVLKGMSIEDALKIAVAKTTEEEIEFF